MYTRGFLSHTHLPRLAWVLTIRDREAMRLRTQPLPGGRLRARLAEAQTSWSKRHGQLETGRLREHWIEVVWRCCLKVGRLWEEICCA